MACNINSISMCPALKRYILTLIIFILGLLFGESIAETSPNPAVIPATVTIREHHYTHHPKPSAGGGYAAGPQVGLFQGNGDIFSSFWNDRYQLVWSIGKMDVWDRRYYGDSKRVVTLDDIKHCVQMEKMPGDHTDRGFKDAAYGLYKAYDFPCPKPVGQILVSCPDISDINQYKADFNMDHGLMTIEAAKGPSRLQVRNYVSALRNVIVYDVHCRDLQDGVNLELYRHKDTVVRGKTVMQKAGVCLYYPYDYDQDANNGPLDPPQAGVDGEFFWIRQRFPAEATYPDRFEYVMMGYVPDVPCTISIEENVRDRGGKVFLGPVTDEQWKSLHGAYKEKRYAIEQCNNAPGWLAVAEVSPKGDCSFTAYVSVMTTRDSSDPYTAAKTALQNAAKPERKPF